MWIKLEPVELYFVLNKDNGYWLKLYDNATGAPFDITQIAEITAKWVKSSDPSVSQQAIVTIANTDEGYMVELFFPNESQPSGLEHGEILLLQANVKLLNGDEYAVPVPPQTLRTVKPIV